MYKSRSFCSRCIYKSNSDVFHWDLRRFTVCTDSISTAILQTSSSGREVKWSTRGFIMHQRTWQERRYLRIYAKYLGDCRTLTGRQTVVESCL
jgi:hypothetical protein